MIIRYYCIVFVTAAECHAIWCSQQSVKSIEILATSSSSKSLFSTVEIISGEVGLIGAVVKVQRF